MVKFHEALSERTVYLRYFGLSSTRRRVAHERLSRICFVDYDRQMVLVAEDENAATKARQIIAVGRLSKLHVRNEAEFALVVRDDYQGQRLGEELLRRLTDIGRKEKLSRISALILRENNAMQAIAKKLGYQITSHPDPTLVAAGLDL
jgi:acetyltransferase